MQVRFADAALADIEIIFNNIVQDDPSADRRMVVAIVAAADRLSENPRLGRVGAMHGTFEVVIRPYVLVYEIHRTELERFWNELTRRGIPLGWRLGESLGRI